MTRVVVNVGGQVFETYEATLSRFPDTLLGGNDRIFHYCAKNCEYFFDRNRLCFEAILYFYQSHGILNCPTGVSVSLFEEECRYFAIPQEFINRMKLKEGILTDIADDYIPKNIPCQMQMWNLLENPSSSRAAWMFGTFSLIVILLSIVSACAETVPTYNSEFHSVFHTVELMSNIWFLTELILRFIFSPSKLEFVRGSMNWIDMLAVVPYFFQFFIRLETEKNNILGIFRTLKFMRVVRLFRLSKHSRRIKIVGTILKGSVGNFKVLMMCLLIAILMGGSFMYYAEVDHQTIDCIPEGMWWGVVSITSVGYGDRVPLTTLGKTLAICFIVFGAVTMSLPVITILSDFAVLYPKNVECDAYVDQYNDGVIQSVSHADKKTYVEEIDLLL